MLINNELLLEPILYLSYYFKKNHSEYYQKLNDVNTKGNFEGWIKFYLKAIKYTSIDAYKRAKDIDNLANNLQKIISQSLKFSEIKESMLKALDILFIYPVISINALSLELNINYNQAEKIINYFTDIEVLKKEKDNFKFKPYLDLLEKDYD